MESTFVLRWTFVGEQEILGLLKFGHEKQSENKTMAVVRGR